MKRLLLLPLLIPSFIYAQSHSLFAYTKDKYTDEITQKLITPVTIKKTAGRSVVIDLMRSTKYTGALMMVVKDPTFGCTSEQHMVRFLFSDNTTFSAYNGYTGCDGDVILLLVDGPMMNKALARKMQEEEIASIRIDTDKSNYEFSMPAISAKKLKAAALQFFQNSSKH